MSPIKSTRWGAGAGVGQLARHRQWGRPLPCLPACLTARCAPHLAPSTPQTQFNSTITIRIVCSCLCLGPAWFLIIAGGAKVTSWPFGLWLNRRCRQEMSNRSRRMCVCVPVWGIIKVNCVENWRQEGKARKTYYADCIDFWLFCRVSVVSRRDLWSTTIAPNSLRPSTGALNVGLRADCGCGCGFLPCQYTPPTAPHNDPFPSAGYL